MFRLTLSKNLETHKGFLRFFAFVRQKSAANPYIPMESELP